MPPNLPGSHRQHSHAGTGEGEAPIRLLCIGAEERSTLQDVRTAGLHSFKHQKYR